MSKYKMTLNLQLLNHLGLNLYSNAPAVISEAVANAWDADATKVDIQIDSDKVSIFDDGCGMDVEDINTKYLNVGRQRRVDSAISPIYNRPVMGRKGIGKLSLFSIANTISVYSVKDTEKNALRISTDALRVCIENNNMYFPEELPVEDIDFEGNGTKIVLSDLKKKRTAALSTFLKRRIARRFSIIGDQYNFSVIVNGSEVTISDRNYLPKAQMLWIYPSDEVQLYSADALLKQCNGEVLKDHSIRENTFLCEGQTIKVYGWIATASEPSKLQDDEENINRITIMVRGKMAKEDVLPSIRSTAIYTKYVFGEIHADFLDSDDMEDITTSSRQDFFEDDERYTALLTFLKNELGDIRKSWEDARSNAGVEAACKYRVVKDWYDNLGRDSQKAAKQLFGKINQMTVTPVERLELFKHGIIAFESSRMRDELSSLDEITVDDMEGFLSVAGKLDILEERLYYQIVQERLQVIQHLREVVDDNALEKVVQHHLAKNLWLLDPSWDRSTEMPEVERSFRKLIEGIDNQLTREELDARLDIKYKKASGKHIIIELKRGARVVPQYEAFKQIQKYSDAMEELLRSYQDNTPFEIIMLVGEPIGRMDRSSKPYYNFVESIKPYHARIMYYSELLHNAELLYGEFLNAHEGAASLLKVIEEIS